jgi:hypothetical protein
MTLPEKLAVNAQCRECARLKHELDADCNDCKHFQRGAMVKSPGLTMFLGTCGRDGSAVKAYPNWFTGKACYESRPEKVHTCIALTREELLSSLGEARIVTDAMVRAYTKVMDGHTIPQ